MKNKKISGRVLAIASTVFMFIVFYATFQLYFITGYYYLYFFIAVNALMFGAVNLMFCALKYEDTRNKLPIVEVYTKIRKGKKKKVNLFKKHKKSEDKEKTEDKAEKASEEIKKPKRQKTKFEKKFLNAHFIINILCLASFICVFYFCINEIILVLKISGDRMSFPNVSVVNLLLFIIIFVMVLVLDKLIKYSDNNTAFVDTILKNYRLFFRALSIQLLFSSVCLLLELYSNYPIQKYIIYISVAYFFFYAFFIVISLLIIAIRKEFTVRPLINVPRIHLIKKNEKNSEGFLDYLEKNTGISMKSLWSVKYLKKIAPTALLVSALLVWLSTCIVIVGPYQQAAVYRIGALRKDLLEPGIHLTYPYPFDKAEIYDSKKIQKVTIGYKSNESTDNIWTASHGDDEYKLLLGGGDELVSINLRLEYKISDLQQYLKSSKSPESIMEALAYELVMEQTISTDLSSLLSVDRYAFANNFRLELTKKLEEKNIGLEVVSVVLESIHPPVEIADVYQELISAEITAEKYILDAQAYANVSIAKAQTTYDSIVCKANSEQATKVSKAKSNINEFMASVEANEKNPDAYHYQKYLAAVREAYGKGNLVIVGNGIDKSSIIFGNFGVNKVKPSENTDAQ